jgi:hypothetical protein
MKKSPITVFVTLVFAVALACPAFVADAAGPASKDYEKKMQPPPQSPVNPNAKAFLGAQTNPNQPAKPAPSQPIDQIGSKLSSKPAAAPPQTVKPVIPPAKPPAPSPQVKNPATSREDAKKNAAFVGKVNTAPGTATPASKATAAGYNETSKVLGR